MMRLRIGGWGFSKMKKETTGMEEMKATECEVRPSGMLVQKRNPNFQFPIASSSRMIVVRVKYGADCHDIHISAQANFAELKRLLAGRTGLHAGDQKLVFKGKDRDSAAYLDASGVKDNSKIVLLEDPAAQARRCLDMHRAAKDERDSCIISRITLNVDRLAYEMADLERVISEGGSVGENKVNNLIDMMMNELVKLDEIMAVGEINNKKRMQVRRVQKYVEKLDILKIKNAQTLQLQQQSPASVTRKREVISSPSLPSPTKSANAPEDASSTGAFCMQTTGYESNDWVRF